MAALDEAPGAKRWTPLEANPEVMNSYVSGLGVSTESCSFADVFGLDEEDLSLVPQPVLAVIMCFPITPESDAASREEDEKQAQSKSTTDADQLFYMKQTIGNACGTIAILHAVCNNMHTVKLVDGGFVASFMAATKDMGPEARGRYLEKPPQGAPNIETAHQAAAAVGDSAPPGADEDVNLHFVAFVQRKGTLWSLDGRRRAPVSHGPSSAATLLQDTAAVLTSMASKTSNIRFNLIAMCGVPA